MWFKKKKVEKEKIYKDVEVFIKHKIVVTISELSSVTIETINDYSLMQSTGDKLIIYQPILDETGEISNTMVATFTNYKHVTCFYKKVTKTVLI